jgi:gliding motility-associated-like protein
MGTIEECFVCHEPRRSNLPHRKLRTAASHHFCARGDGLNDRLNVGVAGLITLSNFSIFNKWGEMVFKTSKLNTGWDGIYKGVLQNTGSFIWLAEGKDINGNSIRDRGSFTLIR